MTAALFGLSGAAAGVVQVWLLGRSARGGSHPLSFVVRLLLIAALLVLAATSGQLLPGALGWVMGFFVAIAATYRRLR